MIDYRYEDVGNGYVVCVINTPTKKDIRGTKRKTRQAAKISALENLYLSFY